MKLTKDEAIYRAFIEVVPHTLDKIKVQVEEGEDEYGEFVRVHWEGKQSSKIRYETIQV